jgi:hypothetical protein
MLTTRAASRRLSRAVALSALTVLACAPVAAAAPDSVLDFEDLSVGAFVGAYHGVEFGDKAALGFVAQPGSYTGIFTAPDRSFQSCDRELIVRAPGLRGSRRLVPQCNNNPGFVRTPVDSNEPALFAAFAVTRSRVSLRFRPAACVDQPPSPPFGGVPCDMRVALLAFSADGHRLAVDVAGVRGETLSITRAQNDIAFIEVGHEASQHPDGELTGIDDLVFDNPDAPPPPDFFFDGAIASKPPGQTYGVPLRLRRVNGSAGPVTLSHGPLPPGIDNVTFTPNPATTEAVTAAVTLSKTAPPGHGLTFSVTATPQDATAGPQTRTATITVNVREPFTLSVSGQPLRPCGAGEHRTVTIIPDHEYLAAPIRLDALPPAGITVQGDGPFASTVVGSLDVDLTVSGASPATALPLRLSAPGFPDRMFTVPLDAPPLTVDSIVFDRYATPGYGTLNTAVATIHAHGMCPGTTVEFGTPSARVEVSPASDGTIASTALPRQAIGGYITVRSPGRGTVSRPDTRVQTYRDRHGFPFGNYASIYTSSNIRATFSDATLPDGSLKPWASALWGTRNGGSCFGMSLISLRMAAPLDSTVGWPRTGVELFDVLGPSRPSLYAGDQIQRFHMLQMSAQYRAASDAAVKDPRNVAHFGDRVADLIAQHNPPLLEIWNNGLGHILAPYAVRPRTGGGWLIDVYDPNIPFDGNESAQHEGRLNLSTVTVKPNGDWSYPGLGWAFGLSEIHAIGVRSTPVPGQATVGGGGGRGAIGTLLMPDKATLSDAGGAAPKGVVRHPPLDAAGGITTYDLPPSGAWKARLPAGATLGYDGGDWSASVQRLGGAQAASASARTVQLQDGARRALGISGAGRVQLFADHGAGTRAGVVDAPGGATLSFDGAEQELVVRGSGTATIALGAILRNGASSSGTVTVKLGRKGTARLRPSSWTRLAGARVRIRAGKGTRSARLRGVTTRLRVGRPTLHATTLRVPVRASGLDDGAQISVSAGRIGAGKRRTVKLDGAHGTASVKLRGLRKGVNRVRIRVSVRGTVKGAPAGAERTSIAVLRRR